MNKEIEQVIAERASSDALTALTRAAINRFMRAYYDGVPAEELATRMPRDLAGAAIAHLELADGWRRATARVRVFNPTLRTDGWESTHTIVQVVTLNRPYLVDSLTMVINELGFTNHIVIHPILDVERGPGRRLVWIGGTGSQRAGVKAESYIHIEIDRETDNEALLKLEGRLRASLDDVALAVDDWPRMLDCIGGEAAGLRESPMPCDDTVRAEAAAFLHWVLAGNMTVLGVREYTRAARGKSARLRIVKDSGLGILREPDRADVLIDNGDPDSDELAAEPIILTKSDSRSTVHRADYLDYVGVRRFGPDGRLVGELRILGLYTSSAYFETPRAIPIVRQKIQAAVREIDPDIQGHDGRALLHVLNTYPRAELFEADVDDITRTALGIVHLQEHQRVRVFIRPDRYGRYYACQVYVPRDHFDTDTRRRIEDILKSSLHGERVDFTVNLSEGPLARLYMVVHCLSRTRGRVSPEEIEQQVATAARPWTTALQSALMADHGEEAGLDLYKRFARSFPAGYREDHPASEAVEDIPYVEAAAEDSRIRAHIVTSAASSHSFTFKLFSPDRIVEVSRILPILENMGVTVRLEHPYEIALEDERQLWIHDYECTLTTTLKSVRPALRDAFNDAVSAAWYGEVENDRLNALVLTTGLPARRITVLRAYARYLRQSGTPYGIAYINDAIAGNPAIAQLLADLFDQRFDPARDASPARARSLCQRIEALLEDVVSLDEDRILRTIYRTILATVRTNYFQTDGDGDPKPYVSLKFLPADVPGLPDPKPAFEIFVYSPAVEGVHLRGGKISRGGLRWSDRPEDYRTEILGLMKAQSVKNAVIVPVGAKGGFVVKTTTSDRAERQRTGIACYRTFIRGLLDVTDNYIDGAVVPPPATVRHDDDDPYLVVAADKGTATFSDIANELSAEYGFWLGDAFASGGTDGYDHKKMGITARGAWESVRHHGEILGLDVGRDPFSVVGVGDMAGDVFGNGMLLSRQIRLIAAFNHEAIFIDPDPDPAVSFAERRRLFRLRGSRWSDYDPAAISKGGGIYSRASKTIKLGPEARTALGTNAEQLAPEELITAILRAPVDLVWNGGIGTYVKASEQRNEDVGDKANDRVRINADALRARMIGEGGNLGLTQLARRQFAAGGGLVNADWIDNSGGVDCSDHEVNIKILLNREIAADTLTLPERNALLKRMQKDVAAEVLDNNRAQARTISYDEIQSRRHIDWFRFTIAALERDAGMDRELEILPDEAELTARAEAGLGLYRPELATLIAWAKIAIFRDLEHTELILDPRFDTLALDYFPAALRSPYADAIQRHPLRNEIVATRLAGLIVDRMGITFAARMTGETGVDLGHVARAWILAHEGLGLDTIWEAIEGTAPKAGFDVESKLALSCRRAAERATRWLIRTLPTTPIAATIAELRNDAQAFSADIGRYLSRPDADRLARRLRERREAGVPARLAQTVSHFEFLPRILPLASIARRANVKFVLAAACYAEIDAEIPFTTVYDAIEALPAPDIWADRARIEATSLAATLHIDLTETAIRAGGAKAWAAANKRKVKRLATTAREFETSGDADLAKVLVLLNQMKTVTETY